ncbi:hypothetical protein HKX48_006026 [Thoreauomyces humboldtii]|nr:hypothetical protein HKX48_006026 [Thoreauomyces humboldtii]
MSDTILSPSCVRAIVWRMQRFALFNSIAGLIVTVMFNDWRWSFLSLLDIGFALLKLWVLSKNNPRHIRYLSYYQRFLAWINGICLLIIIIPAFALTSYLLSTRGDDMCPPGELFAGIVPCDQLKQAVRSWLSMYLFLILMVTALSIYYSKVLTRYAKLLDEAPQSFQLEDGGDAYGQVQGAAKSYGEVNAPFLQKFEEA